MNETLNGKRIFIVEDNSLNRVVYQIILRLAGATLEFDRRGDTTLSHLRNFMPDLIILDLMLGRYGSGFEIFEEIRKLPEYDYVPIVAISSSDPSVELPKCRKMGFTGFIAKPIQEELLQDQLARLIQGEQVWYVGERYGGETQETSSQ